MCHIGASGLFPGEEHSEAWLNWLDFRFILGGEAVEVRRSYCVEGSLPFGSGLEMLRQRLGGEAMAKQSI
jgi:hypothetical protein